MKSLKHRDIVELVLKEMDFRLPKAIIAGSLHWVYNPMLFKSEYNRFKKDVDQYFMHLSSAISEKTIHQLTVEMSGGNATLELELISAKILLTLQEFTNINKNFEIRINEAENEEWMAYFFHNHGEIIEGLHAWKDSITN